MSNIDRFYKVLVIGAFAFGGCSGDPEPGPTPDAAQQEVDAAPQGAVDAAAQGMTDAQNANDCCPAECAQNVCTCMGEEISCCWLVVHPLCDNLCEE